MLQEIVESQQFYDEVAPYYTDELDSRTAYIGAVNELVIGHLIRSNRRIRVVDVGCGNGQRAQYIREAMPGLNILGIDSSREMIKLASENDIDVVYTDIADELSEEVLARAGGSDVALCLWNVLGHIKESQRQQALANISELLSPNGTLIIDVNNRYNRKAYGSISAVRNFVKDLLMHKNSHNDFTISREIDGHRVSTNSHIFSYGELAKLLYKSGFVVRERSSVNYETGKIEQFTSSGQVYVIAEKIDACT